MEASGSDGGAQAALELQKERATVVGRLVSASMGAVRVGGSGRPVPSVTSGGVRSAGAVAQGGEVAAGAGARARSG